MLTQDEIETLDEFRTIVHNKTFEETMFSIKTIKENMKKYPDDMQFFSSALAILAVRLETIYRKTA